MRIVGGQFGGLSLKSPPGRNTRPTSDRVRESLFNILFHRYGPDFRRAVDFFAGTGALGLEALSRGLESCVFFESDKQALKCLAQNIEKCRLSDRQALVVEDGELFRWRKLLKDLHSEGRLDLIFSDPPYHKNWIQKLATSVLDHPASADLFHPHSIWICEVASDDQIPKFQHWQILEEREFGDTRVIFFRFVGPH